ncbi:22489_t:CDS:2 [Cetraspora pellucida]|uniref:22489_t:CDS:1 n=1 Tax=Cetraspora pellucida TaxID=1433469 RepID=A0A9N9KH06_9GLOM|nr:22489_t:CDS:2 [Cetraspora pellucida]
MYSNGISINKNQIDNEIKVKLTEQTNLMQINKKIIDQYEGECRYYALCLIVNSEKEIWMSYRNNPSKDYYTYYQVAEGGLEPYESFIDYRKIMFKTVIYLTITDKILQLTESDKNSAWEAYTINEFKNLKVTDSLRLKESVIIEAINSKFRNRKKHKSEINHESQKQVKIDPEKLNEPESTTSSLSPS